jgi:ABC-type branched-subunit amino acid transport system ATPase component
MEPMTLHSQLRQSAQGMRSTAAATELLIRTGYAKAGHPWIMLEDPNRPWIDFQGLTARIGALSGGQQRILRIAASIGASVPIVLGDEISGLDYDQARLALAAIAQASGYTEPTRRVEIVDDQVVHGTNPALIGWPE